jgi:hypothetical protein
MKREARLTYDIMASAIVGIRENMSLEIEQFEVLRIGRQIYIIYDRSSATGTISFSGSQIDAIEFIGIRLNLPVR